MSVPNLIYIKAVDNEHLKDTFTCDVCDRIFQTTALLEQHQKLHKGVKPYKCGICNHSFDEVAQYKAHVKIHESLNVFQCPQCQESFTDKTAFENHRKSHIRCHICGMFFWDNKSLKGHLRTTHADIKPHEHKTVVRKKICSNVEAKHLCKICGKFFRTLGLLRVHVRRHLKIRKQNKLDMSQEHSDATSSFHSSSSSEETLHHCDICCKSFPSKNCLLIHALKHLDNRPFQCELCGMSFSKATNLKIHEKFHMTGTRCLCHVCGEVFFSVLYLNNHMKKHEKTEHQSKISDESLCSEIELFKQEKLPTNDKLHHCVICNMSFTSEHSLLNHQKIHAEDKPYKCNLCSKGFTFERNLQLHMTIHLRKKIELQ